MRMKEILLHTDQLAVGYRKKALISDITFSVRAGEILTLIGPNGAGKSTILKSITQQIEPIAGTFFIKNTSVRQLSERELAQTMSILMTQRIEPERMQCIDVVASGRYPYTGRFGILSDTDHQKVREAMQLVHITDLANRDFNQISDGQRQRVMLAKAICQEPDVLILDEPTSFLDIRHKLELLNLLKRLVREKQLAVIVSLHELDLAQKVSDFIMCVNGDHIDRYGTPDEIFTDSYIEKLYGVTSGSYHALYGSLELEPPKGTPQVFVIGGGGTATPVYRQLQRKGVAFATGVLSENDLDYPVAKALAVEVISEKAFEPISNTAFQKAAAIMQSCEKVICCVKRFGTMNDKNRNLMEIAKNIGKLYFTGMQNIG